MKIKNKGKTNRNKGFQWERDLAQVFRDLGYLRCKTTRQTSRLLDSCKVDLDFIPYNIQAKNVIHINYKKVLDEVKNALQIHYPERLTLPTVILHKRKTTKLAIMEIETFIEIVKRLKMSDNEVIITN